MCGAQCHCACEYHVLAISALARQHVAQRVLLGWCETISRRVCLQLCTRGGLCLCLWPVYLGFR